MSDNKGEVKIVVCGAGGRMGGKIISVINNTQGVELAGGVELPEHEIIKRGIGEYLGIPDLKAPVVADLDDIIDLCDVVIDFTSPDAGITHLRVSEGKKKGLVVGTTGFSAEQREAFKRAGEHIPVCLTPNMSMGVNLLFSIAGQVAKALGPEYEPEIIEIHHHLKRDAPSGTALQLAEVITKARGLELEKAGVYGRKGLVGIRKPEEIGIHAVRTGDVVGEHTVIFGGPCERIELTHRAHSRDVFAYGAVKAAIFVATAAPGYYNMQDVLGLAK